ncbi:hypothetical protein PMAYCL1PPCAC_05444, partial [Pristionchus mayeri]
RWYSPLCSSLLLHVHVILLLEIRRLAVLLLGRFGALIVARELNSTELSRDVVEHTVRDEREHGQENAHVLPDDPGGAALDVVLAHKRVEIERVVLRLLGNHSVERLAVLEDVGVVGRAEEAEIVVDHGDRSLSRGEM